MHPTIINSIGAIRSTRRHPQIATKNSNGAKIRSAFLVLSCSALLATALIVLMQRLNTPMASENGSSAKRDVTMEFKADLRQHISDDEDLRKQRLSMENDLREASENMGLANLADARDLHEEIRIWGSLGSNIYPLCLQLTRTQNANQAIFLAPKVAGNMAEFDSKGDVIYARNSLGPPRSGWENLYRFLADQGIGVPMKFEPERDHLTDPDEGTIALEARSGAAYSMVFFHMGNEHANAKKALDACRRLESEFGINLSCKDW